jgi:rhodanese-related sulfurtransferase
MSSVAISILVAVLLVLAVVIAVAVHRFKRAGTVMQMGEFFYRLLRGKGYHSVSVHELYRRLNEPRSASGSAPLLVDLREPESYAEGLVQGAVLSPMDDFLREVVVHETYNDHRQREMILLCDTGHKSRVVASILAEDEGFSKVVNVRGGFRRYQRMLRMRERAAARCCPGLLVACCR